MSDPAAIKTNVPEFSVSELSFALKRTLEENYGRVRVRGELSRVTIAASGHMYSSLKDDQSCIDAVCWRGTMSKLSVKPEEGLEVICTGRITTYPARSNYQLIIDSMELAGEGALLKMLEERRKKLAAEGLFDEARKKPLPFLPEVIGVVTSPTGAVIRDILHRLRDRFPRHVLLWPVMVQGETAAAQIAKAIEGFNNIPSPLSPAGGEGARTIPRPNLLIVARGGGSLEDLMPFNEENVVRAIAASKIPVISAVGHETDTTLADYAADLRAPTPTGAAELAVPRRADLLARILEDQQRLLTGTTRLLAEYHHRLEAQAARLGNPARMLETQTQTLDRASDKLLHVYRHYLNEKKSRSLEAAAKLRHPREIIVHAQKSAQSCGERLLALRAKLTQNAEDKLKYTARMLESLSYQNVLERGFVVVEGNQGLITDAAQTSPGQIVKLHFRKDKKIDAVIGKGGTGKKNPSKKENKQETLF